MRHASSVPPSAVFGVIIKILLDPEIRKSCVKRVDFWNSQWNWTESANLASTASPFERYARRQGRPSKSAKPSRAIKSLAVLTGEDWMRVQRSASFALDPDSASTCSAGCIFFSLFCSPKRCCWTPQQCGPTMRTMCSILRRLRPQCELVSQCQQSLCKYSSVFQTWEWTGFPLESAVPEFETNVYDRGFGWIRYPILMYIHQICHWNDTILMNHQILGFSIQHVYGLFKAPHLVVHHRYVASGSGL